MHTHLAWRILAFVRVFFFSMYQFGFFPLTSTVCGKRLVNIQEWAPFYINRQFSFCNKLMSSCNLAKHFGVWKQTHFWKVHILRKINVSCFYCFSWLRNSTPQFSSSTETLPNEMLLTHSLASLLSSCSWDGLENWRHKGENHRMRSEQFSGNSN